jgi:hypothetical protein
MGFWVVAAPLSWRHLKSYKNDRPAASDIAEGFGAILPIDPG